MESNDRRTPEVVVTIKGDGEYRFDSIVGIVRPFMFFERDLGEGWSESIGYPIDDIGTITATTFESSLAKPEVIVDPSRIS